MPHIHCFQLLSPDFLVIPSYTMALRAEGENSKSTLPGLSYFWQDTEKPPINDWEQ